jgi:hypothetical protein
LEESAVKNPAKGRRTMINEQLLSGLIAVIASCLPAGSGLESVMEGEGSLRLLDFSPQNHSAVSRIALTTDDSFLELDILEGSEQRLNVVITPDMNDTLLVCIRTIEDGSATDCKRFDDVEAILEVLRPKIEQQLFAINDLAA